MSELTKDVSYLRACLSEALLDLHVRSGIKSTRDTMRDSRVVEAVLLLLDRVVELEKKGGA